MIKVCTRCNTEYPATTEYFSPHKNGKYGVAAECRVCFGKRYREYRVRNKSKVVAYSVQYRKDHPDWTRQAKRRHYERHRDQVIANSRKYRRDNPDKCKITPERQAAKDARRRAREQTTTNHYRAEDVSRCLWKQQDKCFYCEADLANGYHVDHYVPLSQGGSNSASNIVAACSGCNLQKNNMMPQDFIHTFLVRTLDAEVLRRLWERVEAREPETTIIKAVQPRLPLC